jgi:hypothetical protein
MFGFSGYRGSKPFCGLVDGKQFRLVQRIYSNRNSFPPVLTGAFQPEGSGTRVSGTFDLEPTSKIAIGVFGVFGLVLLITIVAISHTSHPALLIVFICGYGGTLLFAPRIFRGIGEDQEKRIAEFLCETLVAREDLPSSVANRDR